MRKISSGIPDLDSLIDSFFIGDNVVWEIDAGTAYKAFIREFLRQSFLDEQKVIYISFNRSPMSIISDLSGLLSPAHFVLIDCFTAGKGKNDATFRKFYESAHGFQVIRIDDPRHIDEFTGTITEIEDSLPVGARYIFDSLTGMQDLWGSEHDTYRFFTYMCPRLYDLGTVAYWILEKEAHSSAFKANLRHITQVVLDLSKKKDKIFLKALKLDGRTDREAFKSHAYDVGGGEVRFLPSSRKERSFDIGSRIRDARTKLGMSQKDLADRIGLTSSFVSQTENNQISPSLNSFLQIAAALNIEPADLFQSRKKQGDPDWLMKGTAVRANLVEREQGYSVYGTFSAARLSGCLVVIDRAAALNGHFSRRKKDEFIYVLKGALSVTIDHIEKDLQAGDALLLTDSIPSRWQNSRQEDAELLVVSA